MALAQQDNYGSVIRMPGRAAEVVQDGRRDTAVEVVHIGILLRPGQDLELGAVRLDGMNGSA